MNSKNEHEFPREVVFKDFRVVGGEGLSRSHSVFVYSLIDPRTGRPFYVGRSINGLYAVRSKWRDHRKLRRGWKLNSFIRELLAAGHVPDVEVIEVIDDGFRRNFSDTERDGFETALREAEPRHIVRLREAGHELLNVRKGGEFGHRKSWMARLKQTKSGSITRCGDSSWRVRAALPSGNRDRYYRSELSATRALARLLRQRDAELLRMGIDPSNPEIRENERIAS